MKQGTNGIKSFWIHLKFKINKFNKVIYQEEAMSSGAAIAQLVMSEYGKDIKQKDFSEMIDYVKQKSGCDDADFQTWRLILKMVLSSPAKNLKEQEI
ncbi:hypothetical protein ACETAC_05460 [Aceticella autotrophica]|uniref:Uncharacterized protein n=1 Tax=Aceticella autotrophica TaxID=2755338 RepID=A0A974Y3Z9_9THEO|nr:hypothetical protein [Aceticella autotrophica]QSZ26392.1 hypothetical protein ACETAC_05460 [Aceticella autotrophica]